MVSPLSRPVSLSVVLPPCPGPSWTCVIFYLLSLPHPCCISLLTPLRLPAPSHLHHFLFSFFPHSQACSVFISLCCWLGSQPPAHPQQTQQRCLSQFRKGGQVSKTLLPRQACHGASQHVWVPVLTDQLGVPPQCREQSSCPHGNSSLGGGDGQTAQFRGVRHTMCCWKAVRVVRKMDSGKCAFHPVMRAGPTHKVTF